MVIGDIVDYLKQGFIRTGSLASSCTWSPIIKSRMIESLLVGFPIPTLYFEAVSHRDWVIIDGKERINALNEFFNGDLKLQGLELLPRLEGKAYKDLEFPDRRDLRMLRASVEVLEKGTPSWVKEIITSRLDFKSA